MLGAVSVLARVRARGGYEVTHPLVTGVKATPLILIRA